jgi:O-antigen ligase
VGVIAGLMPFAVSMGLHQAHIGAKYLLLVGGAALLAVLFASSARTVAVTPLWRPIGLLAATCALHSWQPIRIETTGSFVAAFVLFGAAVCAFQEQTARDSLADIVTTTGAAQAAYILCQVFWMDPLLPAAPTVLTGKWRAYGTFGNPNWAGEFLAMALPITLGRLVSAWSRVRLAAFILIATGLAATFARGAWLACAAGLLALLLLWRPKITRDRLLPLAAAALAFTAIAAILAFREDMFRYLANTASIRGRFWLWYVTLQVIAANPLGAGPGQFGNRFAEIQAACFPSDFGRQFLSSASLPLQAHNDYLQIGAEFGVAAMAAAIILAVMIVRRGKILLLSGDTTALGFWAAVVAMLVNALYAFPLFLPGSLGLCALFLGAAESGVATPYSLPQSRFFRLAACTAVLGASALAAHGCWRYAASEVALRRANTAIGRQSWDQAATELARAIQSDPGRMEAYYLSGELALLREDYGSALAAFEKAGKLGYKAEVFIGRSNALWHMQRREEAIRELETLLWLRPDAEGVRKRILRMRSATHNLETP